MQKNNKWSQNVTKYSHAMDLEPGVFTWKNPLKIAKSLSHSALSSHNLKATPFQSAMSMLNFYINRAGEKPPSDQKKILTIAKDKLRMIFKKQKKKSRRTNCDAR